MLRRSVFLLAGAAAAGLASAQSQEGKLLPSVEPAECRLGFSAALSGATAVAGAPLWQSAGIGSGALFVYERNGIGPTPWNPGQLLVPTDRLNGDSLGWTVAIDGDIIVAGAPTRNEDGLFRAGAAYVFTRVGGAWAQTIRLNAEFDLFETMQFGYAVGVDDDAGVIAIGAPFDVLLGNASGSAFVFTRDPGLGWIRDGFLTALDGNESHRFGHDVAVDGDLVVIGAPFHAANGPSAGSAYIFERSGGAYLQVAQLFPDDAAAFQQFGHAVAVQNDVVVVTAPGAGPSSQPSLGAAYVFVRDAAAPQGWRQADRLSAADGESGDALGFDVAIDGDRIVLGARDDDDAAGFRSGSIYLFTRIAPGADDWSESGKIYAADPDDADSFGYAVGISGETVVAGAPFDEDAGALAGALYTFHIATSAPCSADRTRDGLVDVFDLLDYLDAWFAGDADLTGDDATDVFDLLTYLDAWFAQSGPCP